MQAWSIWQQSCHHEEPERQHVASWWYHWSLDIILISEISIHLDFFGMWFNKGLLSWASLSWLKGPTRCNISSSRKTSHSISINTFTPFLASGLNPCLCPSCQATGKLIEDSGDSSPGQMSSFMEQGHITKAQKKAAKHLVWYWVCLFHSFASGYMVLSPQQCLWWLLVCTQSLYPPPQNEREGPGNL